IEDYSRGRKPPSPHPYSACWRARPVLGESRRVADQNWIPRHGLAPSGQTPCHPHQGKNRCEIRTPTLPALPSGSSLANRPALESGCRPASGGEKSGMRSIEPRLFERNHDDRCVPERRNARLDTQGISFLDFIACQKTNFPRHNGVPCATSLGE